jgi:hypothetical protein
MELDADEDEIDEKPTMDPEWREGNVTLLAGNTCFNVPDYVLYWASPVLARTSPRRDKIELDRDALTIRLFLTLATKLRLDTALSVPALASLFRLLASWECATLQGLAIERLDTALQSHTIHPLKLFHLGLEANCPTLRVMALCFTTRGDIGEPLYHTPQRGGRWEVFAPDNWPFALWQTLNVHQAGVWALAQATSISVAPGETLAVTFERLYAEARSRPIQEQAQ